MCRFRFNLESNTQIYLRYTCTVSVCSGILTDFLGLSRWLTKQIFFQMLNPDYAIKFAFANDLPFEKIAAQVLFFLILTKHDFT